MNEREPRQEPPPANDPPGRPPFRWTERRVARLAYIISSAAVVAADVVLFAVYRQHASAFLPPWDVVVPIGIAGILLFAAARLHRQIRLFREDR